MGECGSISAMRAKEVKSTHPLNWLVISNFSEQINCAVFAFKPFSMLSFFGRGEVGNGTSECDWKTDRYCFVCNVWPGGHRTITNRNLSDIYQS